MSAISPPDLDLTLRPPYRHRPCRRAAFLPDLALFPVLYVDEQLAVFKFPPLNSNIAVRKVQRPAIAEHSSSGGAGSSTAGSS
jgi:hypothetical protein